MAADPAEHRIGGRDVRPIRPTHGRTRRTTGPSRPTADRGAGGHGLVGIRERVSLFGGTLHAGPGPVRGWQVTADLRLDDAEPDVETDVETDVERVAHA